MNVASSASTIANGYLMARKIEEATVFVDKAMNIWNDFEGEREGNDSFIFSLIVKGYTESAK